MIADVLLLLFPLLAAVPLVGGILMRPPSGVKRPGVYIMLPINSAVYFLWQWYLNAWGYDHESWLTLQRLVDPFIQSSFTAMALGIEAFDTQGDTRAEVKAYVRSILGIVLLNALVQAYALFQPLARGFPSALLSVAFILQADHAYTRFSQQVKTRYRLLHLFWLFSALIPLPVARLPFLFQMAYILVVRQRDLAARFFLMLRTFERERVSMQKVVHKISVSIQDFANLKESLAHFLATMCDTLEAKAGAVYVWDEKKQAYFCTEVHGYFFSLTQGSENVFTRQETLRELALQHVVNDPSSLVWECGHKRKKLHLRYASQDPRVQALGKRASSIQTLILEPLVLDQTLMGVLVFENKYYERYFTTSDVFLVRNFSHQAAIILNTSRLAVERSERERVQMELTLGTRIQSDLLPATIPQVEGISLAGSMSPAREIGGDYYDFIPRADGRLGIVIGDVSGKGVPAGMVMTILQTLLHSAYGHTADTKELLVGVNAHLSAKIKSYMFVTLLFFEWDPETRRLCYTSCGHEHILHFCKAENRLDTFKSGGLALGMVEDNASFIRERELLVSPGDTVLLYTDGIIEARNPEDEMYGLERLKRFLESHHGMEVDVLHRTLIDTMTSWRRDREQIDDITCIVMRF